MVEIDASRFSEYTHSPESAWEQVEGRILKYFLKEVIHRDKFYWLRHPDNKSIDAITTEGGALIPANFSVLDLGTGTGRVAQALIDYGIPGANMLGVDNNLKMLDDAHFPAGVNKLEADITDFLPKLNDKYPKLGNFDLIVANMVFHLLNYEEYVSVLKQVRKRATRNAEMLIIVPHPLRSAIDTIGSYHGGGSVEDIAPWGERLTLPIKTIDDYRKGLDQAGFDVRYRFTCGANTEVFGRSFQDDCVVRSTITDMQHGSRITKLPEHFRLWMGASPGLMPIENYKRIAVI